MTELMVEPTSFEAPLLEQWETAPFRPRFVSIGQQHASFSVTLPKPAPREFRVTMELGKDEEANAYWSRIEELDVSAEGDTLLDAYYGAVSAARTWLEYLRDDSPELDERLEKQSSYVVLLDAPSLSWFKQIRLAG